MILQDVWAWAFIAVAAVIVAGIVNVSMRQAARREAERRRNLDLYDRRFAIYMAFHDLLLAAATKSDVLGELHRAAAARVQCRFLLNESIGTLLDDLMTQVLLLRSDSSTSDAEAGPHAGHGQRARRHREDRLRTLDRIDELASAFEPVMKIHRS